MKPWQKSAMHKFSKDGLMLAETEQNQMKLDKPAAPRNHLVDQAKNNPSEITQAYCEIRGIDFKTRTKGDLHDLNYCAAWCKAWGKSVVEYLSINSVKPVTEG